MNSHSAEGPNPEDRSAASTYCSTEKRPEGRLVHLCADPAGKDTKPSLNLLTGGLRGVGCFSLQMNNKRLSTCVYEENIVLESGGEKGPR